LTRWRLSFLEAVAGRRYILVQPTYLQVPLNSSIFDMSKLDELDYK
jgi:hypothetical protein